MRYNIFHVVHKGLKASMYQAALDIVQNDFWNTDETAIIIDRVQNLVLLFEKYTLFEDGVVLPAIGKYEPSVTDCFEKEHRQGYLLGKDLLQSLSAYQEAPVITSKAIAGRMIQHAYTRFLIFNIEDMTKKEDVLNKILWRYYSDAELAAISRQATTFDIFPLPGNSVAKGLNNAETA